MNNVFSQTHPLAGIPMELAPPDFEDRLERHLEMVNARLASSSASAMGAYCMGMATPLILAESILLRPTPQLLDHLMKCGSIAEGFVVIKMWIDAALSWSKP